MTVRNYDPKKISIIVAGQPISGFASGTFVKVQRDEELFALVVGADGESTRAKSANRSGKVTITLLQTSQSNDTLNALAVADELSGQAPFAVLVKDNRGTSIYAAATAWITKTPDAEYGKETGTREWTIQTDELVPIAGGSTT